MAQAEVAAAAEKGEVLASVSQDIRLDNRVLDLRTPANQAIFKLQHAVCQVSICRKRRVLHAPPGRCALHSTQGRRRNGTHARATYGTTSKCKESLQAAVGRGL